MTGPRTTGKASEKRRAAELESVAFFMVERCEAAPSEFLPFREMYAAYKQFCADVSRETYNDVEMSASLRPGWDGLTPGQKALLLAQIRESFATPPVMMGPGMFSVALIRLNFEPFRRRQPGYPQPISVIAGLRLIEPRPMPIETAHR